MAEKMMPMLDGPPIPWATAELVYQGYALLYGTSQSIDRIAERGGFSWTEVGGIFELVRRKDHELYKRLTGTRATS